MSAWRVIDPLGRTMTVGLSPELGVAVLEGVLTSPGESQLVSGRLAITEGAIDGGLIVSRRLIALTRAASSPTNRSRPSKLTSEVLAESPLDGASGRTYHSTSYADPPVLTAREPAIWAGPPACHTVPGAYTNPCMDRPEKPATG